MIDFNQVEPKDFVFMGHFSETKAYTNFVEENNTVEKDKNKTLMYRQRKATGVMLKTLTRELFSWT